MHKKFTPHIVSRTLCLFLSFMMISTGSASARGLNILRDTEIELTIRHMSEPLFEAAELDPDAVGTYLIGDKTLNAFVTGGQNIFLHSGLLLAADNASQVIGVIAHETGHITGGHATRFSDRMKGASTMTLLGMVLGAAAIAAGSGDAGMALILGGQEAGRRTFLKYNRIQESEADQAGITLLEKSDQSGVGLLEFLDHLGDQELLSERTQDPYARSHPVSGERIAHLRERVESSPFYNKKTPPAIEAEFKRLQAKLYGYLKAPYATLAKYPLSDQSLYARYARTFAYHKKHKVEKALTEINSLIAEHPDDPFFYETKGQVLFENGRVDEAIEPYRLAVKNIPEASLIRVSYAQALISTEDDAQLPEAIKNLEYALSRDPSNGFGWHQASVAYHRMGNEALTRYATAERFLLMGNIRGAMINAKHAMDALPKNSPRWIRAQDIMYISRANIEATGRKKDRDRLPPLPDENKKSPQKGKKK